MASKPSRGRDKPRQQEPGPRHQGREAAVQVLYGMDSSGALAREMEPMEPGALDGTLLAYWTHLEGPLAGRLYCDEIVRGVNQRREEIDAAIRLANPAWRIDRMARVDRNVIRIATWEMLFNTESSLEGSPGVAPEVAMDEAIQVARRFGTEDSAAFVNGTLDKIASMHGIGSARESRLRT